INLSAIENTLFNHMFKQVYAIIEKTSGAEKKDLKKMFDANIDLRNFTRISRLKKYYQLEPDEIKKQLLPFGSLKEKQLEALCNAQDEKELLSIINQTSAGRILAKVEYNSDFEIPRRALYQESYKRMYFSVNPSVVLVAYFALAETETENIIHIIEGVRYKVPDETVKKLLIYK
ncbi:MAG: V-type ATPase subunit, partial [Acutalibacteraceae bacterium]|nr:V-type ATPase subunit [Acutalibacteraceae bacterium]